MPNQTRFSVNQLSVASLGALRALDFNQANLKTVLPHYYQHVDFAARGVNALDLAYTNVKKAYKAVPCPHLGNSDHFSVMLTPAYRTLLIQTQPSVKQIKVWPEGAVSALQDCFDKTGWNMFREAISEDQHINLESPQNLWWDTSKCIDDVTVTKHITRYAN